MDDFQLLLPDEETDYYENYFTKTEALFSALRGRTLLLSPADYQLARKWYEQGIPLSCVLRGIRAAFFARMEKGEEYEDILSLSFCKWAVTKEWKEYKSIPLEAPRPEEPSSEKNTDETQSILDSLVFDLHHVIFSLKEDGDDQLSEKLHPVHGAVVKIKENWNSGSDLMALENSLLQIDQEMLNIIYQEATSLRTKALQAVNRKLKSMELNLDEEALFTAREQGVRSKIREMLKLPRITLYSAPF